jgi:hypothetical protein
MEAPHAEALAEDDPIEMEIHHPAHVGEVLKDPDGGAWMRGRVRSVTRASGRVEAPLPDLAEQAVPA